MQPVTVERPLRAGSGLSADRKGDHLAAFSLYVVLIKSRLRALASQWFGNHEVGYLACPMANHCI